MTAESTSTPADDRPEAAQPSGETPEASQPHARRGAAFWLKLAAAGAGALLLAAFFGAYLLPREPEVTRSIEIAAPRAAVFPLVADLRHLPEWSPLLATDPQVAVTFTGPLDGVGQTLSWKSALPAVGSGVETITEIEPGNHVAMRVTRIGEATTKAWFRLSEKSAGRTTVVWGYRKDVGFNPLARYRALGLDGVVGPGYERGLKRLKAVAEAPPASDASSSAN